MLALWGGLCWEGSQILGAEETELSERAPYRERKKGFHSNSFRINKTVHKCHFEDVHHRGLPTSEKLKMI